MDGHSGVAPPGPISNPEVKRANVAGGTALERGNPASLSTFLFLLKKRKEGMLRDDHLFLALG